MVTLLLDRTQLEIVLSPIERAVSLHRGDLHIPRETIAKVQLTQDSWPWLRGVASPGTHVPGILAAGTWESANGADFVLIRRRRPGVIIDLDGHEQYQRLIIATRHGLELTQALHGEIPDERADVHEIASTSPVAVPPTSSRGKGGAKGANPRRKPKASPSPA